MSTPLFDGPLDLLLYLIRRDGISVRDIPIAHITEEYVKVLRNMRTLDLNIAGDFLVMAATLCQLKSRDLLPVDPTLFEEEEDEDPRQRLMRRLIEFERYKEAAEALAIRPHLGRDWFVRPTVDDVIERPLARELAPMDLAEAYSTVLRAAAEPEPQHVVEFETWSLERTIDWLLERLELGQPVELHEIFEPIETRGQKVQTFMAVLEMARMGYADVYQEHHLGPVQVTSVVARDEADLSLLREAQ